MNDTVLFIKQSGRSPIPLPLCIARKRLQRQAESLIQLLRAELSEDEYLDKEIYAFVEGLCANPREQDCIQISESLGFPSKAMNAIGNTKRAALVLYVIEREALDPVGRTPIRRQPQNANRRRVPCPV